MAGNVTWQNANAYNYINQSQSGYVEFNIEAIAFDCFFAGGGIKTDIEPMIGKLNFRIKKPEKFNSKRKSAPQSSKALDKNVLLSIIQSNKKTTAQIR